MDVISLIILIIFLPVLVKFMDRAYKSSKKTDLYKDLFEEDV